MFLFDYREIMLNYRNCFRGRFSRKNKIKIITFLSNRIQVMDELRVTRKSIRIKLYRMFTLLLLKFRKTRIRLDKSRNARVFFSFNFQLIQYRCITDIVIHVIVFPDVNECQGICQYDCCNDCKIVYRFQWF